MRYDTRDYVFATASADNIKKWKCPNVSPCEEIVILGRVLR